MHDTPFEKCPFHRVGTFTVHIPDIFLFELLGIIKEEFEHHVVHMVDFSVEVDSSLEVMA
ncbi:hypothetical protein SDC9_158490 [bioreactor metagenome]|uniref:Uncharacterized protein n=1 Tax=bioreactor metagenome TaxID=1076179 RepID=A0A645FCU8_9ZZZZ